MFLKRLRTMIWLAGMLMVCLVVLPAYGNAAEEILDYFSDIQVAANGDVTVEETITVNAERRRIRRGIYRDFPIRYLQKNGLWRRVGFKLLEVTRNGKSEPHHTERKGNFKRIYIGEAKTFIPRSEHRYTIKYRTSRQILYFKEFDEIFWNATGNFWIFPINKARARITLPNGAHIIRKAGYTGYLGARGTDYIVSEETTRTIVFETTRRFHRRQGLSVAVAFPKGIVKQPLEAEILFWRLWDNIGLIFLMLGTFAALIYYIVIWQRIGRDPEQGIIIPMFKPPAGLSPAVVSYIHYWGFKSQKSTPLPFIAGLISLAVKGRIKIGMDDKEKIELERLDTSGSANNESRKTLSPGESIIEKQLLGSLGKITFNKTNGKKIKTVLSHFKRAILREYEGDFFRNNYSYLAGGIAISVITLVAFLFLDAPGEKQLSMVVLVFIAGSVGAFLLFPGLGRLFGRRPGGGSVWLGGFMTIVGAVVLIPVILSPIALIGDLVFAAPMAAGALAIMNVAFFFLLRAPTLAGRTVMDHIEGFKLYLTIAEAERMNLQDAPDMTTELYETYLPFAIGLGVEKPWSNAFTSHMARIAPDVKTQGYHPAWYSGRSFDSSNLGAATSGIAASIASSTASAMPSSSGSGGGGFSGGGGGGGGGGGW